MGLKVLHLAPGEAAVAGEVRADHLNLHGTAHGGFLYALADSAFALASNTRGPAPPNTSSKPSTASFTPPVRSSESAKGIMPAISTKLCQWIDL